MTTYTYEVAPWCPTNLHDPELVGHIAAPDRDSTQAIADDMALAAVLTEHLPTDKDAWAQLPQELAAAAWEDIDKTNGTVTVAGFNVTGPRGTYQTRLTRPAT